MWVKKPHHFPQILIFSSTTGTLPAISYFKWISTIFNPFFFLFNKVIGQLCQTIGCDRIVDIGAGLGHLSRLLNFKYGLTVTTVEASSGHAPKAQKYDL